MDKFGNSQQLQHARQAATRHGRLLVAATFQDCIVVISIETPKLGNVQTLQVLEPVWRTSSSSKSGGSTTSSCMNTYVACTGIKADATFVISTMRQYCKQLWEQTNIESISQERLTQVLSTILLEFMGYNRGAELSDGILSSQQQQQDETTTKWARPLGVQTLILTPSQPIVLVEPSGVAISYDTVCAIGKDSAQVMKLLKEYPLDNIETLEELQKLLVNAIRKECKRVEGKSSHGAKITVHVMSKHGSVQVSSEPLVLEQSS